MTKSLEGKVAIVTGSGQGVGRGIALFMAKEGAKVITNNRKPKSNDTVSVNESFLSLGVKGTPEFNVEEMKKILELRGDAESTAQEIMMEGGEATPFYGDVSEFETAGKMVQLAIEKYGRIDIVVNNAAGMGFGPFVEMKESDWDYQTVSKLKGAYNLMSHAMPYMIKQGFGRILNCASDAWTGIANLSAYSAANAGIVGLTKSTAKELDRFGITVNTYCPQADSPGHMSFRATLRTMMEENGIKMDPNNNRVEESEKEHGPAENVAPFLVYLCTEQASYVNGAVFTVTGGGRISLYSEPKIIKEIKKTDKPWTVNELINQIPETLLKDYVSIGKDREF
ncbi:SDR family oxidoreductase [Neobacillus drentensis]|uniref:SDR family NAD(P)-dependent oxidoreductase n=1 Tax=Neobacillus drentensis TaxID=220684 RepID=UPI001F213297|nr:SDR family NAD(P)-dependent oxidoreductase [Neobacillus drentensis]ULT54903.1 SDR family oxidoreductase [Neobacillus drentensis]